jgi:ATP-dependent Lon protease
VDIHIHVPEGAVPKDGPSAGITMATALASELTGLPVRPDVAMTGEITLRGRVLPIGGLREKLLAAVRADIRTVLIPFENEPDLEKVPEAIRDALEIIPVHTIDEVLGLALQFETEVDKDVYDWLEAHPPTPDYAAYDPAVRVPADTESLQ